MGEQPIKSNISLCPVVLSFYIFAFSQILEARFYTARTQSSPNFTAEKKTLLIHHP